MATALATQLAKVAANSSNSLDLKAQKKAHSQSLIFDPPVAATQDFDTVYQICLEGYQELCQLDGRFLNFARSIFSEQSKKEERSQMTAAANKELDVVLESFLGLVGGRLLLKPALKAVEWLIRRFRVHEHNIQCLMLTFLPYHTLPIFPTLLSILPRALPPTFKFLHPYIESLVVPPRHTIVYAATHNQAFFSALNGYVIKVSRTGHTYRSLLSFWATIATEAVAGMLDQSASGRREVQAQKQEDILLRVLPFLDEALTMRKALDLRVGCYMILTVLASKAELEDHVLIAMMEAVVSNWTHDTTHAGLICLAVLAQRRNTVTIPRKVFKAVMSLQSVDDDLRTLNEQYQVEKLALGLILGIVGEIAQNRDTYRLTLVRSLIETRLMNDSYISAAIKVIVLEADKTNETHVHGLDVQGQLADLILRLSDSDTVGHIVQDTIKHTKINIEQLEMRLQAVIPSKQDLDSDITRDVDMDKDDASVGTNEDTFGSFAGRIPTRTAYEISFLSHSTSYVFESLSHAFLLASSSSVHLQAFSGFAVLRKSLAMTEPLFLSFFVRLWCGPYPPSARAAAMDCVTACLRESIAATDVQVLLPYLISALGDHSAKVRRAGMNLVLATASLYATMNKENIKPNSQSILGYDNIYGEGKETKAVAWLSTGDATKFIEDLLRPTLEECLLDASYMSRKLVDSLNGSNRPKGSKAPQKDLKTSLRVSFLSFLSSHVLNTPLYSVKLRILSMLNRVEKVGSISRTKSLLPLLVDMETKDEKALKAICDKEQIDETLFTAQLVGIVSAADRGGLHILQRIVTSESSVTARSLRSAAAQRIVDIFILIKPDLQSSLAQSLLDLATTSRSGPLEEHIQSEGMETLRKIPLSSNILLLFLESLPALSANSTDTLSTPKRRRTSQGHVGVSAKSDGSGSTDRLRKITIVLELLEASTPETHPQLLHGLFQVLADIQHSKSQLGTELNYLQSLALGSLLAIVKNSKTSPHQKIDPSKVRADLLVDCLRTTANPQVQNSALLLMSSLASVVPEVIIHSVMPIFTFMGTTVLRQNDDYSAHVIKQTIESVVPPLVHSLHKQKGNPIAGISELLVSFVAAFEHIPSHRRQGLFYSLVDKLGPHDFLFALLGMLIDKYAANKKVEEFAVTLASHYNAITQLITIEKYLDLVADVLLPKPTISEHLVGIHDNQQPESIALNLLSLPPHILRGHRLISRVVKGLIPQDIDSNTLRATYSRLIERTLLMADQVKMSKRLYAACGQTLDALLGLLSMEEFVASIETLLERPDTNVRRQVLRSLEHRIKNENPGNSTAQQACLNFLPQLTAMIEDSSDPLLKHTAVACADQIVERFGKKDMDKTVALAEVISGDHCLGTSDPRLRNMALLCLATSVEVLGEAVIPIIPQALPKSLDYLGASIRETPRDERLHNSACSFLGTLILYIPWILTGPYLDRALTTLHKSAVGRLGKECDQNRVDVLALISKRIEPQDCFAALDRTWTSAMSEGLQAVNEHLGVLRQAIEQQPKSVIVKQSQQLLGLFLKAFDLRRLQFTSRAEASYDDDEVDQVEITVHHIAIKMVYKLNDTNFRPLFTKLVDWATTSLPKKDKKGKLYRQATLYNFLHTFFETLKSIVTSYASFMVENTAEVLNKIIPDDEDSVLLWKRVLKMLHAAFEHDQDEFWQAPSHFAPISRPLLAQLGYAGSLPVTTELIPAITELAIAADSADHHKDMNAAILKYMRSDNAHVRLAAVQCEQSLTERLGEEWLSLLPEMLPFISELQEDDDEAVERETQRWILRIEAILGESLDSMLQ